MTTKTPRVHNLAPLRADIKTNAIRARELRIEARATSHDERHHLKCEANDCGEATRYPHLALGYLRGRTIEQMESATTHPDNLPSARGILAHASDSFLTGPDAPAWNREEKVVTPVEDDRGFLSKLIGTPAPGSKVTTTTKTPPGWDEFKAMVEADLKAWHAQVLATHAMKVAMATTKKKVA